MQKLTFCKISLLTAFLTTMVIISSCSVSRELTDTKDLSYIYNPVRNIFTPYYSIYSQDASTSVLSIRIRRNELYFNEANPQGVPMASIYVSVKLYDNTLGGELADTAAIRYDIRRDEISGEYVCKLLLTAYQGKWYSAEVKIIDLIRQRTVQSFVDFEKSGTDDRYNFRLREHFSHNELFNNVVKEQQYINVLYPAAHKDTLWISYYPPVTAIPPAPTVLLPEVTPSDTPQVTVPVAYSDTLPLMFPRAGLYLVKTDSISDRGITLINLGSDYPTMTSPETMIPPLAYLATPEEMEAMMGAGKPKVALDDFWFRRTGSIERSKELLRIYYNRTLYANYYFTSYKAGWLTDRGMIFIIYGPPDKLYKNADGESWGYKLPKQKSRWGARFTVADSYLWFNFGKRRSIFTDNDYILNRATTPVSYWDIAVARWREGKVFRPDNPEGL